MATQEDILNSNEAELILNSETFKEAIKILKDEYINLWLSSKGDDINKRENLHKAIKLLPEVEKHMRIIVEKGKITKAQLGRLHKDYFTYLRINYDQQRKADWFTNKLRTDRTIIRKFFDSRRATRKRNRRTGY